MTDVQKVKLQKWWMEQLREITRKTMEAEDKRQRKTRAKADAMIGDLAIERREDIDDLYGYGTITERQREKLIDLFENGMQPDVMYEAKIELLQDAYSEAQRVMHDLGQEV